MSHIEREFVSKGFKVKLADWHAVSDKTRWYSNAQEVVCGELDAKA